MKADIQSYFAEMINNFLSSPIIDSFNIVREWQSEEEGYLRARCTLINGDTLEVSEYFEIIDEEIFVENYTFHWQDVNRKFVKRWDNVKHHKEIETFPYHIHEGEEKNIKPSEPMNHKKVLKNIQNDIEKNIGD